MENRLGRHVAILSVAAFWMLASCQSTDPCNPNPCTESYKRQCTDSGGEPVCSCDAGFHDNGSGICVLDQQCMPSTCSSHGQCSAPGGVVACLCNEGYTGTWCERCATGFHLDLNGNCVQDETCDGVTCSDHGTCVLQGGLSICVCNSGYAGSACGVCAAGYHDTGSGVCVLDQQCLPSTCSSHGQCSAPGGVVACLCNEGYIGTWCERCATGFHLDPNGNCVQDETCDGVTCSGHGSCHIVGGVQSCVCSSGYAGPACGVCASGYHDTGSGVCVLDQQCLPSTCSSHGQCSAPGGVVTCLCSEGYTGSWCERCATGFHFDPNGNCVQDEACDGVTCSGHGSCQVVGGIQSCVCSSGYAGPACGVCAGGYHDNGSGVCFLDQQCLPSTCSSHGQCSVQGGVIACLCNEGYTGTWCERCATGFHLDLNGNCVQDETCDGVTCSDRGTCIMEGGLSICVCNSGYAGMACGVCAAGYHDNGSGACVLDQQCLPSTCSSHGQCSAQGGVVACICGEGYTGTWCERCDTGFHLDPNGNCVQDETCDGVTCSGHGACQVLGGVQSCNCSSGYAGLACGVCAGGYHENGNGTCILDQQCLSSTCMGHGDCTVQSGVVMCACFQGYAGTYCDTCAQGYHWGQGAICLPCTGDVASGDTDDDHICNNQDTDDDGDNWSDTLETACGTDPLLSGSTPVDSDNDGVCDSLDICAGDDASGDTDGDNTCNDQDTDDDGDTWSDTDEIACGTNPLDLFSVPTDSNHDNICDAVQLVIQNIACAVGSSNYFGRSVSVSNDGSTAIVGASDDDTMGIDSGSAYILQRSETTIICQGITAGDGAAYDYFGTSVSISSDGSYVIVGADWDDGKGNDSGSAYIFKLSGTTWSQVRKLAASDGADNDYFGHSVSISSDGSYAIVGAYLGDDVVHGESCGSAYIFLRSGTTWGQQAKLTASDGTAVDAFGTSVSISGDGSYAIVGAFYDDDMGIDSGSAYIFQRSGTTWSQQAKLIDIDGTEEDFFGYSVSISSDGSYAIVGAFYDDDMGRDSGSATIFQRSGTTWSQQAKLTASDGASDDWFGYSVSINSDGSTAIVGAYGDDYKGINSGSAYIFQRSGTTWSQQAKLAASNGASGDGFGYSVSISGDGSHAVFGAPWDDDNGVSSGSAYVY